MEEWGVPDFHEMVLVTNEDMGSSNVDVVQRIVRALKLGFEYALENPQESIDILMALGGNAVQKDVERGGVKLLLPLWDDGVAPDFTWQASPRWESFAAWMKVNGLVDTDLDVSAAFTNRFVDAAVI